MVYFFGIVCNSYFGRQVTKPVFLRPPAKTGTDARNMSTNGKEKIVLSLGGSLVVPQGGIDVAFLKNFNNFIRTSLHNNPEMQFFIVVGGGTIARQYRDAGEEVLGHELTHEDLDWLGIHATRLNAQLIRTIFRDIAHPHLIKHYEIIRKVVEPVIVAAGWKPGWSTDFCATLVCEDYDVKRIVNLSNIDRAYDSDPRVNSDAKPIEKCSWDEFRQLVGEKWTPGMNAPFDPVASRHAQELGLTTVILKGSDFDNLTNYMEGKEFIGTLVEG